MEDTSEMANWLQQLLSFMGYKTSVDIRIAEESPEQINANTKNYWLEINAESLQPEQIQRLIGQDGTVIDSLQYLANACLNHHASSELNHPQNSNFYTVELNGYRSKRLTDLQSLADTAVQQVREMQNEFVIKQLSSADRRYIHQLLEGFPDVETHSHGREPNRHLIVKLVKG